MHDISPTISASLATPLEDLIVHLKQAQQVDLSGYKRSTLLRRIRVRMKQISVQHDQDYLDYLKQHPDEVTPLLDTVLINFTGFFRDRPVWSRLENEVIPQIIANKAPNEPIRVWSTGCASGEETYSLAILLAEALGAEQFQQRVRIYGTDLDAAAIVQARKGCYPRLIAAAIPPDRLERYFESTHNGYRWRRKLRSSIRFSPHDLLQDAPLPQIDLLLCRNVLIYLTAETQIRALVRFHFSLQQSGFLVLGQAENLVSRQQRSMFNSINPQTRIFTKVPGVDRRRLLPIAFRHLIAPHKHLISKIGRSNSFSFDPAQAMHEHQQFQIEQMQHQNEALREQVRSLQAQLHTAIAQQHDVEQELNATYQELELLNQELQHRL